MILKTSSLTPQLLHIIKDQGTEQPFTGEYDDLDTPGTYLCRQCGLALYRAQTKFHSGCGWPSFDNEIAGAVERRPDADGRRTEILCIRCHAHLGHVFTGEGFTAKNTRHCVNSLSLDFIDNLETTNSEEAIFAAGCFWGVEHYLKKLPGVVKTEVGYSGGHKLSPAYEDVCQGNSGHLEVIRVLYDPGKLSYEQLLKYFFEIHDFTQTDGQGPDLGQQYLSAVFYYDEGQQKTAQKIIKLLQDKNYAVVTQLKPVTTFWPAEKYHQEYYSKTGKQPYCHHYTKRFD